jgi:thioredoxin-like negative regulator of GroEL
MDISSSSEHTELATELDLQRLPTYVVYKGGQEVCRLARTSERKRLGQVLQEVLEESLVAESPVVMAAA